MEADSSKRPAGSTAAAPALGGCIVTIGDIAPTILAELKPPKPPAPAPAAKPPVATGVKPRGLLMPVVALMIMIIPLIGLCLPVYLTSAKLREAERDSQAFACHLYTVNNPSPLATEALKTLTFPPGLSMGIPLYGAWLGWAITEAIADMYPDSAELRTAVDGTRNNFTALEPTYFSELQKNCSEIGEYVWGGKQLTKQRRSGGNSLHYIDADVEPAMRYLVQRQRQPLAPRHDNETGQLLEPDEYGIALVAAINSTLVALDVNTNAATMSFELRALSYNNEFKVVDERGRVSMPGVSIKSDVVSAIGAGDLTMKTGDRAASRPVATVLTPIRGMYYYPFDSYYVDVRIQSYLLGPDGARLPLAVIVSQRNLVTGWVQQVSMVKNVFDNYNVWWLDPSENAGSDVLVGYRIHVQRSNFVKFFACLVLIVMWTLTAAALTYAVDLNFLRPRNAMMMECTMMITLLFAMGNIRNVMPGIPGIGVGIDQYGYIWIMILLMAAATTMLGKLTCQYVHPLPTLYDRLVRNECYTEWRKKEDDKEKKAKEEAEKKKQEEAEKKQKEAEGKKLGEAGGSGNGSGSGGSGSFDAKAAGSTTSTLATPRAQVTQVTEGTGSAGALGTARSGSGSVQLQLQGRVSLRKQGDGGMDATVCGGVI
ncbi:hypothetical protein HYH02_001137 [Chlamydomonas schloesseri]|uniref:Uncharacterized protein n=1 Tax=Chlamydomonas schloesseri TaxID=2026947 RepID=A0A835WVT0_9CHLO|nr:hypothetical protein HYH02_001137 [Chlamydomonas schloesseri]|eukprot:KAG2454098.1 hypothetical protein HYH02_001137 [Chlamydomonas schloesseri]